MRTWLSACLSSVWLLFSTLASAASLEFEGARHLLLRAGFGPEHALVEQLAPLGREAAVDLLLQSPSAPLTMPECATQAYVPLKERKGWNPAQRQAFRQAQVRCGRELQRWYARQLAESDAVLREQMTLFWHNHFTSSLRKVREPYLMASQHRLLHDQALGRFDQLLHAVVTDPAMLIYLDNVNNRKRNPNENLARELLELFTLGEGHYTEQDIPETARALSGLSIDPGSGATRFYGGRHDKGAKTIFGVTAHFDSRQLVELILRQPATAEHIVRKLWLHFISVPDEAQIKQLAADFRRDWEISRLVRAILLSAPFWRDQGRMIKSPVELMIGNARLFNGKSVSGKGMPELLRRMGQELLDPPNVKGWAADEWTEPNRMLIRISIGERLVRGFSDEAMAPQLAYFCDEREVATFSAVPLIAELHPDSDCQQRIEALVTDPAWQLK